MDRSLFSSASAEWETPTNVYDYLNNISHFKLDPCSTKENHKCENYFTKETDGLHQKWYPYKSIFMNPVYGNAETPCKPNCIKKKCITRGYHTSEYIPGIEDWVCHAFLEAKCGSLVVC
jgi:phage N-6-adenine-methyltransferase